LTLPVPGRAARHELQDETVNMFSCDHGSQSEVSTQLSEALASFSPEPENLLFRSPRSIDQPMKSNERYGQIYGIRCGVSFLWRKQTWYAHPEHFSPWPRADIWKQCRRLPSTNAAPAARSCCTRDVLHSAHHCVYM